MNFCKDLLLLRKKQNKQRLARVREIVQVQRLRLDTKAHIYKFNDQMYVVLYFRKFLRSRKNKFRSFNHLHRCLKN